jgi:hypothetical protein
MAKLNEWLKHSSLEDYMIHPSTTFLSTFIAENCDFIETYNILYIYYKLTTDPKKYSDSQKYLSVVSNKALQSTKRAKCYCDWNNP